MNELIEFRGKSYFKSEWWTGFYIYSRYDDVHYIVQNSQKSGNRNQFVNFCHFAEVDPKSVGQWSGLVDKHKVRIYSGDVVVDQFGIKSIIVFHNGSFRRKHIQDEAFGNIVPFNKNVSSCEVIGNLTDNPELTH